jgi:hypothetical protein
MRATVTLVLVKAAAVFVVLLLASALMVHLAVRATRARHGLPKGGLTRSIHLRRDDALVLKDPPGVEARVAPLLTLGFGDGGTWVIEELKLAVRFLAKPDDGIYAAVYDRHPVAGIWVDLVTLFEDGTSITVNDLKRASALDERPGHTKVRIDGATVEELHARLLAERPRKPMLRLTPADIPARFEKAYADEMAWRDARGGPTEDEIRRIAAASGKTITDEQIARAKALLAAESRKRGRGQ